MAVKLGVGILRPHYLLELNSLSLRSENGDLLVCPPDWVEHALHLTPFVVVRRAIAANEMIPVGVRGSSREQRLAAFVHGDCINRVVTPFDLLDQYRQSPPAISTASGAFRSLASLAERWRDTKHLWGPGGSVGFELATNVSSLSVCSDLDVVIYADVRVSIDELIKLGMDLPAIDTKLDIQIEAPHCGFLLSEYIRGYPREVLLKTPYGPVLSPDPWADDLRRSQGN